MPSASWSQVLAWRMQRQFLDSPSLHSPTHIVARLCGVQAQVATAAELAVAVRQVEPERGGLNRALWEDRSLVKTWAMRGTLHLLPVDEAVAYLALVAATRTWERASWQKAFGATPDDVDALTEAIAAVLDGTILTREALVRAVIDETGSGHLEELLKSGWGTLLKPVAWRGYLCQGPPQGTRVTFTRPDTWVTGWRMPTADEAAPMVIRAYLRAHGPTTLGAFDAWLTRGQTSKPRLREWFTALGDELTPIDVEGRSAYVLSEDVDELLSQHGSEVVRLLPGFDQYVLGPGTGDERVIPADRRSDVSRTAGWISPVVIAGGRVVGVWELPSASDTIKITLWEAVDRRAIMTEAERLSAITGIDLAVTTR